MTKRAAITVVVWFIASLAAHAQKQSCVVDEVYAHRGGGGMSVGIYHPGKDVTRAEPFCQPGMECIQTAHGVREPDTVRLWVIVAPDGMARVPRVIEGLGPELDALAKAVVESWLFTPGCKDGKSVWTDTQIDVRLHSY
jgi:hypothetical protein